MTSSQKSKEYQQILCHFPPKCPNFSVDMIVSCLKLWNLERQFTRVWLWTSERPLCTLWLSCVWAQISELVLTETWILHNSSLLSSCPQSQLLKSCDALDENFWKIVCMFSLMEVYWQPGKNTFQKLLSFFSYASSSTLYPCEWVSKWVIVSDCNLLA